MQESICLFRFSKPICFFKNCPECDSMLEISFPCRNRVFRDNEYMCTLTITVWPVRIQYF